MVKVKEKLRVFKEVITTDGFIISISIYGVFILGYMIGRLM